MYLIPTFPVGWISIRLRIDYRLQYFKSFEKMQLLDFPRTQKTHCWLRKIKKKYEECCKFINKFLWNFANSHFKEQEIKYYDKSKNVPLQKTNLRAIEKVFSQWMGRTI